MNLSLDLNELGEIQRSNFPKDISVGKVNL